MTDLGKNSGFTTTVAVEDAEVDVRHFPVRVTLDVRVARPQDAAVEGGLVLVAEGLARVDRLRVAGVPAG